MIRRVQIRNYRALRSIDVRLDRFHLLIGPNASGKTTFFDALAFVRDVVTLDVPRAFYGDAQRGTPPRCANPNELTWQKKGGAIEIAIELQLPQEVAARSKHRVARYELRVLTEPEIGIGLETLFVIRDPTTEPPAKPREQFPLPLSHDEPILHERRSPVPRSWKTVVEKTPRLDWFTSETRRWNAAFKIDPSQSALGSLPPDAGLFPAALSVRRTFAEQLFVLALDWHALRRPAPPGLGRTLRPDGSNLPWAVDRLEREAPERLAAWWAHVRTALPDLQTITTKRRDEDGSRYLEVTYASGVTLPSWLLSDGTLRLLALTVLPYLTLPASLVLIEEPENGLHPQAIEPVLQSLRSVYDAQVLCASHSPVVLGLSEPRDLLCFGKDASGAVDIVRGDQHPRLREWREGTDLALLFASGVLG
ncbi:MAG: ATPase [Geminicoccaceae bacterium]|nr:MAG: ATPase [Geminicoccaceae bacterium]